MEILNQLQKKKQKPTSSNQENSADISRKIGQRVEDEKSDKHETGIRAQFKHEQHHNCNGIGDKMIGGIE